MCVNNLSKVVTRMMARTRAKIKLFDNYVQQVRVKINGRKTEKQTEVNFLARDVGNKNNTCFSKR